MHPFTTFLRTLVSLPALLAMLFLLGCAWASDPDANTTPPAKAQAAATDTIPAPDTVPAPQPERLVRIIGVGDMMLGTDYPSASYLPAHDGKNLLADVRGILQGADVTFGNLEGTLVDKGGTPKQCKNPAICYVFRSPERYAQHFVDAGFDVLSLANNHSGDFGPEGRLRTKATLKKANLHFAGLAGTDEYALWEQDGLTFGFCAFAPNTGTCDIRDIPAAKRLVAKVAEKADIVIVSFHGGAEGATHQHVPKKTETFYGENRGNVHAFAHAVIDAGADVVFGHGPHVTRAVELYKDRFIAYSLGNFCTYGRFSLNGPAGFAPIAEVQVRPNGEFVEGQLTSTYQQKTHGPKIDPKNQAVLKVIELTKADFPDSPLHIAKDGRMTRK